MEWSCDKCTFKQNANNKKCTLCMNPNPFVIQTSNINGNGNSNQKFNYKEWMKPEPKLNDKANPDLLYQTKPKKNGEYGKIIYTKERLTKKQVNETYLIYKLNPNINTSSWPVYVFGDNDIDVNRGNGVEREMIGGIANVCGDFDRTICYGITTTFYKQKPKPVLSEFKKIMDKQFDILWNKYIKNGHDIIVPSPNKKDLHDHPLSYHIFPAKGDPKQVVFHNIGTGLAMLEIEYIVYIQKKFDDLIKLSNKQSINDEKMDDNKVNINDSNIVSNNININVNISNDDSKVSIKQDSKVKKIIIVGSKNSCGYAILNQIQKKYKNNIKTIKLDSNHSINTIEITNKDGTTIMIAQWNLSEIILKNNFKIYSKWYDSSVIGIIFTVDIPKMDIMEATFNAFLLDSNLKKVAMVVVGNGDGTNVDALEHKITDTFKSLKKMNRDYIIDFFDANSYNECQFVPLLLP